MLRDLQGAARCGLGQGAPPSGWVVVRDALTPEQLAFAQAGARRVIAEQMAATPLEKANRGRARYSFGPQLE